MATATKDIGEVFVDRSASRLAPNTRGQPTKIRLGPNPDKGWPQQNAAAQPTPTIGNRH